jgi:hypothetical protein
MAIATENLEEFQTLAVRQMEIEQHHLIRHDTQMLTGLLKRAAPIDGVAIGGHMVAHGFTQHPIILDQQNTHAASAA